MAITRRQFLKRSSIVTAGGLLGPGLFANPFIRRALADTIGNRYLVVLFLDGGNDGQNTVVPVDDVEGLRTAYNAARKSTGGGALNLSASDLAATHIGKNRGTGTQLALHPGFSGIPGNPAGAGGLKALYDAGMVAVIQGCGYPNYSLSHDESRTIWKTGDPAEAGTGTGWVGRHLTAAAGGAYGGSDIPAVCINDSIAGEFKQNGTSVLAVNSLDDIGFPKDSRFADEYDNYSHAALAGPSGLLTSAAAGTQPTLKFIGNTGVSTLTSIDNYPGLNAAYDLDTGSRKVFSQKYEDVGRSVARDLREIAKVINGVRQNAAGVHARFFQLSNGGYDTHSDQGAAEQDGQQFSLHAEVGASLNVFFEDLADMGVADRVCVLVWSEFSRRVFQNDSGTDHGSQGPMLLVGGSVRGGVYGNHADINESSLDDDGNTVYTQNLQNPDTSPNAFRSTDFRDVYGTVLKHWLRMSQTDILSDVLTLDGNADADHYWNTENFDLKRSSDNADLFNPLAPT